MHFLYLKVTIFLIESSFLKEQRWVYFFFEIWRLSNAYVNIYIYHISWNISWSHCPMTLAPPCREVHLKTEIESRNIRSCYQWRSNMSQPATENSRQNWSFFPKPLDLPHKNDKVHTMKTVTQKFFSLFCNGKCESPTSFSAFRTCFA